MRFRVVASVLAFTVVFAAGAASETWLVAPDGTGDAPTIQAAVDSCEDGDIVALADGTFRGAGNRDVDWRDKSITVRSASGHAASCVVDCEGSESDPHRGFLFGSASKSPSALEGVTITGGWFDESPYGAAVLCGGGSSPGIRFCVFRGNRGSAVSCIEASAPVIEDCVFRDNSGWRGAGLASVFASPVVRRCSFRENASEWGGGAFFGHTGRSVFTECEFVANSSLIGGAIDLFPTTGLACIDCLFLDNVAGESGGIFALMCSTSVQGCVFAGNQALSSSAGAITFGKTSYTEIDGCVFWGNGGPLGTLLCGEYRASITSTIIAGGTEGPSISVDGIVELACCDIFGNAGGDWVPGIADQEGVQGNFSADPLFCDPGAGDFTLRSDSPCLPDQHPGEDDCGLIGVHGEGCSGPTAVERTTWGGVKSIWR